MILLKFSPYTTVITLPIRFMGKSIFFTMYAGYTHTAQIDRENDTLMNIKHLETGIGLISESHELNLLKK